MSTTYQVSDMMIGVRNMIEAADLRRGDQVLLLADTLSDKSTIEALTAGLRFFGAHPMTSSPNRSPATATCRRRWDAMHASDAVVWVWPVFITLRRRTAPWGASARKAAVSCTKNHQALSYLLRRQRRSADPRLRKISQQGAMEARREGARSRQRRQSRSHRRFARDEFDRDLRRQETLRHAVSRRRSARPLSFSLGPLRRVQRRRAIERRSLSELRTGRKRPPSTALQIRCTGS